jgi:hypothetical protein
MSTPPFDLAKAHRWFGIELNNRAWELIEAPARTAEETSEMLSAAHASRYHWQQVGTPLNRLRGELLVATAYLAADRPELALGYARTALAACELPTSEATPFDRACASGCLACSVARLGQREQATGAYAQALEHAAGFEHVDDRALFEKLYPRPSFH